MEAGGRSSRKRKSAGLDSLEAAKPAPAAAEGHGPDPPPPVAYGGAANDRISHLPDSVLGDIISLLPTKEGARTQVLASRWRHLWRSAPLNLDHHGLCQDPKDLEFVVSLVLSAHPGPGRRFCAPLYRVYGDRAAIADAWFRSPALRNLQELQLCTFECGLRYPLKIPLPLRASSFGFSETLRVATFGDCQFPDIAAQAVHFPKLKQLALERVIISESSLHTMIAGCLALQCLLIAHCDGFRRLLINSISLRSIGVKGYVRHEGLWFGELIIENAPCLERLLELDSTSPHTSVISAPKLETLGCLSSDTRLTLDSTIIQGLRVDSLMSEVRTVKILAVDMHALSLDATIDFMRCFPCLERLYIEYVGPGETNSWRRKRRHLLRSFDICLKKISWRYYRGTKSHVDFATFFVLNARVLESMTFQVYSDDYEDEEFIAEQRELLQLDSKASRGAQFHFTPNSSHRCATDFNVHDLELADPFELN